MLVEYQKVKEVAEFLNNRPILGRDVFAVKIFKDDERLNERKKGNNGGIMFDANIFILSRYFYNKMAEVQNLARAYEVARDNFSVKEKIIEIMESFSLSQNLTFGGIAGKSSCLDELFTYFLALLEMARLALIEIEQPGPFDEIYMRPASGGLAGYRSKIASMN